jgi:dephospho-CoA kinase
MLVVGLTGGIGAGKSTLAALLLERGAHVIDADALGRDALRPGRPAWHSVVDQFGDEILVLDRLEIDRSRLASLVFSDRAKLAALNAIVHPVILGAVAEHLERLRNSDAIVLLDAALILETGLDEVIDVLIVVTAPEGQRRKRLVRDRGMSIDDITARMAAQTRTEELVARADIVASNTGSLEDLAKEADRVWAELEKRAGR